jgi:hypothetical protein
VFVGAMEQAPEKEVLECVLLLNYETVFARGSGEARSEEWSPFACPVLRKVKRAVLPDSRFDQQPTSREGLNGAEIEPLSFSYFEAAVERKSG